MWHKPCQTFHPWCKCVKTRCLFVNDTQLGKCPEIFVNYFEKKHSNYDLRQNKKGSQLVIPTARLALGDRALRTNGAKLWNKIHKITSSTEINLLYGSTWWNGIYLIMRLIETSDLTTRNKTILCKHHWVKLCHLFSPGPGSLVDYHILHYFVAPC